MLICDKWFWIIGWIWCRSSFNCTVKRFSVLFGCHSEALAKFQDLLLAFSGILHNALNNLIICNLYPLHFHVVLAFFFIGICDNEFTVSCQIKNAPWRNRSAFLFVPLVPASRREGGAAYHPAIKEVSIRKTRTSTEGKVVGRCLYSLTIPL